MIGEVSRWIQGQGVVKKAKRGKRLRSSSKEEALKETAAVGLEMNYTKGSNASLSMAWYLRRSADEVNRAMNGQFEN